MLSVRFCLPLMPMRHRCPNVPLTIFEDEVFDPSIWSQLIRLIKRTLNLNSATFSFYSVMNPSVMRDIRDRMHIFRCLGDGIH